MTSTALPIPPNDLPPLFSLPPSASPAPAMVLNVPALDSLEVTEDQGTGDGGQETRNSIMSKLAEEALPFGAVVPAVVGQAEAARAAAAAMLWRGRALHWSVGRIALFQSLRSAAGASLELDTKFDDALIFLFLATHDHLVWERPTEMEWQGRMLQMPPLRSNLTLFLTTIREWAEDTVEASNEALLEAVAVMDDCLATHARSRPMVDVGNTGDGLPQ